MRCAAMSDYDILMPNDPMEGGGSRGEHVERMLHHGLGVYRGYGTHTPVWGGSDHPIPPLTLYMGVYRGI